MMEQQAKLQLPNTRGRAYDEVEVMALKPIYYKRNRKVSDIFQMRRAFADVFAKKGLIEFVNDADKVELDTAAKKKQMKKSPKDRNMNPKGYVKKASDAQLGT